MSSPMKTTGSLKKTGGPKFVGRIQPCTSRLPQNPPVDYANGGDDFRCPRNFTSSFGRQIVSFPHTSTANSVPITSASRFQNSETVGVGPNFLAQVSSLKVQKLSNRRSAESTHFGTSTRAGALKLYATYTCTK